MNEVQGNRKVAYAILCVGLIAVSAYCDVHALPANSVVYGVLGIVAFIMTAVSR